MLGTTTRTVGADLQQGVGPSQELLVDAQAPLDGRVMQLAPRSG